MARVLVRNADRMMTVVSADKTGIRFAFADGCKGLVPYSDLPEIREPANLESVELPNPYEVLITTKQGEVAEIPWDFARHYCDPSYRPRVEAVGARGRHSLGKRIRALREEAGLSQEKLGSSAELGRVTLARIEQGKQSPRYETLVALARALKRPASELMPGDKPA